jgi:DNA-binding transcriptional MerR regulator
MPGRRRARAGPRAMGLTIGQVAAKAGISTSTVRYYERIGLLRPGGRTPANYRVYDTEALERLRFIRAAQAMGFSLDDVAMLLRGAPCREVQVLIEARLAELAKRLRDLRHVQRILHSLLRECRRADESCPVIARLKRP